MRGLLAHTISIFEICRSIYDFLRPIIGSVDGLYWASDNTSPVDLLWLMTSNNEELYFKYRIKFGETIRDYDKLPEEFSVIKYQDYAIYRPHMLEAYGSLLTQSEGDTNVFFGLRANSVHEACFMLSQILVDDGYPSRRNAFRINKLIEYDAIFISDISNIWWRIFANDTILESLKAKARFNYKEIDSTSPDEEMATRYIYKLI